MLNAPPRTARLENGLRRDCIGHRAAGFLRVDWIADVPMSVLRTGETRVKNARRSSGVRNGRRAIGKSVKSVRLDGKEVGREVYGKIRPHVSFADYFPSYNIGGRVRPATLVPLDTWPLCFGFVFKRF